MGKNSHKKNSGRPVQKVANGKGKKNQNVKGKVLPQKDAGKEKSLGGGLKARVILITVCALLLVAIGVVTGVLIYKYNSQTERYNVSNQATAYNFEKLSVDKYMDLSASPYKGLTVDLKAYYDKYVNENDLVRQEITDEIVDESIAYRLMTVRKLANENKTATVNGTIGYGDDVSFFVVAARALDKDGNPLLDKDGKERKVPADLFVNAYQAIRTITVGAYTYGEEFDRAFIGLNPANTRYSQNSEIDMKDIPANAVISVSYTATIDGKTAPYTTVSGKRVDLSLEEDPIAKLLLEKGKDLRTGETVSFQREEDINKDGKTEKVNYEGTVVSLIEEKTVTLKGALPEKYFADEGDYKEYVWLNGVTVEYTVVITSFTDYTCYEPKDLTVAIVKEDLGYKELKATDDAGALAEYRAYVKKEIQAEKESMEKAYKQSALVLALYDKIKTEKLPQTAFDLNYAAAMEELERRYLEQQFYYPGSYASISEYAMDSFGYTEEEYESVEAYMKEMARQSVFYSLLMVGVMDLEGLEPTQEEEEAAYRAIIDETIANAAQSGSSITEENVILSYATDANDPDDGEEVLRMAARKRAISEKVEDYLLKNNTFTPVK